ncbi:MAG: efflux RND transporter periplasmic adaptor subunit [Gemmataceae bacterium]|nr:efflux RND transporter periplasmic adaptor subunit [Gemmataceae bacterium]
MTFRSGVFSGVVATLFLVGVAGAAWFILQSPRPSTPAAAATPPAKLGKVLKEDEINGLKLTPEAEKRLGIRTGAVEKKPVSRVRTYGGDITIPAGQLSAVAAPLGGILLAPAGGLPTPGAAVRKGQVIIQLLPLLTPEARTTIASAKVDSDGQVNNANTQVEAARIALDRAHRLLDEQAGSRRAVDEAQAQFDLANKTLEAATARRDILVRVSGEFERGTAAPIPIPAPQDGILRSVSALNGQNVPAGAALFEVVDLSRVWVRVPVYVGDVTQLATGAEATVAGMSARGKDDELRAMPVDAPPSANPLTATVDLFYALDNRVRHYSPGQRVAVAITMQGEAESITVPWSAVIHDIYGGTWVYEHPAPHSYIRRRVQVRYVTGDRAVLATGPAVGTKIVVEGAAELFGTEVGFSK